MPAPEATDPVKVAEVWVTDETEGPAVDVGVQATVVNVPSVPYPVPPALEAYALT